MSDQLFSKSNFIETINKLGDFKGEVVYVSSNITNLIMNRLTAKEIIESLLECVGEEGTLCFPIFNFAFCQTGRSDIQNDISKTGALTEYVRKLSGAKRTLFPPYHSVVSLGKYSDEISSVRSIDSFGDDSVFQYLTKLNAKYLLIDTTMHDSVVHYHVLEQKYNVSYRFWKDFHGEIIDNGKVYEETFKMFARKNGAIVDASIISDRFYESDLVKKTHLEDTEIVTFSISSFLEFHQDVFRQNPDILLKMN